MPSRYTTFSLYLVISLIYLLTIITDNILQNQHIQRIKVAPIISKVLIFLVTSFLILHALTYLSSAKIMALNYRHRLHAKACLLFINFVDEKSTIEAIILPDYQFVEPRINRLNQIHLLKPALVESPNVPVLADQGEQYCPAAYGSLDLITQTSKTEISVSGWAIFPDRKQPADAVVLTYETSKTAPKAFAIAAVMDNSSDVAKALNNQAYQNVRWNKTFVIDKLPRSAVTLSAWAFDTETRRMFRLANSNSSGGEFNFSDNSLNQWFGQF